ncbi:MAG: hypothetical protein HYU66_13330 [Armatimonadetes bacterium]|nr:hypothetical protein [Armatimonadota bacterium]
MASEPSPLRALYQLGTHAGSDLRVERLTGSAAFEALQDCIYGPLLPAEHPAHFPLLSALSAAVPVYRLERPAGTWTADAVAEALLDG